MFLAFLGVKGLEAKDAIYNYTQCTYSKVLSLGMAATVCQLVYQLHYCFQQSISTTLGWAGLVCHEMKLRGSSIRKNSLLSLIYNSFSLLTTRVSSISIQILPWSQSANHIIAFRLLSIFSSAAVSCHFGRGEFPQPFHNGPGQAFSSSSYHQYH